MPGKDIDDSVKVSARDFVAGTRKRPLQHVVTISRRVAVTKWMIEEASRMARFTFVPRPLRIFRSTSDRPRTYVAHSVLETTFIVDCFSCPGKHHEGVPMVEKRENVEALADMNQKSVSRAGDCVRKVVRLKAITGRGRSRAAWVQQLYEMTVDEFLRLKAARHRSSA
uniref:Uncharacterized protein n=1 Tax=Spongospora subterranea TaxID=70186 RepID=A0A0H5RHP1_9EUKA|eukprot:CRZ08185.1 hypothetical protein [Spongospora subterranea]